MDGVQGPAARAWDGAALAWELAAAARRRAGWAAYGRAWTARADALDMTDSALTAYTLAVVCGRVDANGVGRAANTMRGAAETYRKSAAAFGRSAELDRTEAAELESAAEACERSGLLRHERAVHKRAVEALKSALASTMWEVAAGKEADDNTLLVVYKEPLISAPVVQNRYHGIGPTGAALCAFSEIGRNRVEINRGQPAFARFLAPIRQGMRRR